ncbi:hypothetical protein R1sor_018056 [Riccia sorocarpa]|uniref:Uncharacterized protein n=1 Tax=Riccia sorocarpa TaxID=122646 RepID=A0ABD3IBW7_9MARC
MWDDDEEVLPTIRLDSQHPATREVQPIDLKMAVGRDPSQKETAQEAEDMDTNIAQKRGTYGNENGDCQDSQPTNTEEERNRRSNKWLNTTTAASQSNTTADNTKGRRIKDGARNKPKSNKK